MAAPATGPVNWSGAASAVLVDGVFWLTWRVRRPLTDGRGDDPDLRRGLALGDLRKDLLLELFATGEHSELQRIATWAQTTGSRTGGCSPTA